MSASRRDAGVGPDFIRKGAGKHQNRYGRSFMIQWFAFFALSGILVYISRASLIAPGSHGFYRFFTWECILALILLNINVWIRDPFAWYQLVSWILLFICLIPLYFGVQTLVARGKPVDRRESEPHLLAFEKTSVLVTTGIYRYIRHPLYSSLLLLAWGVFFKAPTWYGGLLAMISTLFLYATARADEAECLRFFGQEYRSYMGHTKRFIPYVF
jgi:protein-S-isoprenylcysteine O-methyltransferase Ste14